MMIRVGCCGFPETKAKYYKEFPVVEIQQTFYQLPRLETAQKWRQKAPAGFEFCLKAWQLITHEPKSPTYRKLKQPIPESKYSYYGSFRPTDEVFTAWEATAEIAGVLKAAVIIFQCPASFKPSKENISNLRHFFKVINSAGQKGDKFILAWEPRGAWEDSTVRDLCQELGLIHCVDPFKARPQWGDINYFRLHGITGYRYQYSDKELNQLLKICDTKKTNYYLFNNTAMLRDSRRFLRLAKAA